MKRSRLSIIHRASRLKINYQHPVYNNYYSKEEEKFLKENYSTKGMDYCLQCLPGRDRQSICSKAHQLGLKLPLVWDTDALTILNNLSITNAQAADLLNKTEMQIRQKRISLKLIKPSFTHKKYSKEIEDRFSQLYPDHGINTYQFFENMSQYECQRLAKRLHLKSKVRQKAVQKKVCCIETGELFDSIKDAKNKYKIGSGIFNALQNSNKTAGGYHWKYVEQ